MNEGTIWSVLLSAVLTQNILFSNFLGVCSYLTCSRRLDAAFGLGAAVTFVLAFTSVINWTLYFRVLSPLGMECLSLIVFIGVIAGFVQVAEAAIDRLSPALYQALGIFLPLITVNCAILGACLLISIRAYTLAEAFTFGTGAGIGWTLAVSIVACIREKLETADVPAPLRGLGIAMIVTGLLAMIFMGIHGSGRP